MRIFAGGRASGKTYTLIKMVSQDPKAVYVAQNDQAALNIRKVYRDVIRPDQVITRRDLTDYRGLSPDLKIHVDDIESGSEIPSEWGRFDIVALAIQADLPYANEHVPVEYTDQVHDYARSLRVLRDEN